jgi:predicted esterase
MEKRWVAILSTVVLVFACLGIGFAQGGAAQPATSGTVGPHGAGSDGAPTVLLPGHSLTFEFPDMPLTFQDQQTKTTKPATMTVFLPTNYDPARKFPMILFLNGGDGGAGGNPGVARGICQSKDFICVNLPLFKADTKDYIIRDADCKMMWPLFKRMLAKLTDTIPNIDPANRILGGFSNGAHATGGLIDCSDGEAARWFSAFFVVEGAGRTQRYDLIKGRPLLICYGGQAGRDRTRARVQEFSAVAHEAGVKVTVHEMKDTGHAFPSAEYAFVRKWIQDVALK